MPSVRCSAPRRRIGLAHDSSWGPSLDRYEEMYKLALAKVRGEASF
jgi:hypothetical protein